MTTLSYVMSLMPDTIRRGLQLERHGYRVHPVGPYFVPFPDGRCIVQYDDDARATTSSSRSSRRPTRRRSGEWDAWIGGLADVLGPAADDHAAALGSLPPGRPLRAAPAGVAVPRARRAGRADLTRLLTMSSSTSARPVLRVGPGEDVMSLNGLIGTWAGPARAGYRLRHGPPLDRRRRRRPSRRVGGTRSAGWERWRPRSSPAPESFGAEVRTGAPVARILTRSGASAASRSRAARSSRRPSSSRRRTRRSRSSASSTDRELPRRLRRGHRATGSRAAAS